MDRDIVQYSFVLFSSIAFGHYYRKIKEKNFKKWIGTIVGCLLLFYSCQTDMWQAILLFFINCVIITLLPKRYMQLTSFFYSFSHLLYFHSTSTILNVTQMTMTLKLVGLVFEMNAAGNEDYESPTLIEVLHYCFNYIGISSGPYYRYKTFKDYFDLPFSDHIDCNEETKKRLLCVALFFILHWIPFNLLPITYALTDEFYEKQSWIYRFAYSWVVYFIFRMKLYSGITLSECVCTMAGFGAYPSITHPKPGHGPTQNLLHTKELINDEEKMKTEHFTFETVHSMNPYTCDSCLTVREGMKNWNMCIQYWLVTNVYRRFPSKKFRTIVTLLVSAFWHGSYAGYYFSLGLMPLYLIVEDLLVNLLLKRTNPNYKPHKGWSFLIWFMKMQTVSYLTVAFNLLTLNEILRYYHSTYYFGFVLPAVLYVIGLILEQQYLKRK